MTDTPTRAELREMLTWAMERPWAYRPDRHDDWGFIRGPEKESKLIGTYRPIAAIARDSDVTEADMGAHRRAQTDPYEPNGRLIVAAVNALPALLDELDAKDARIARLEEGLRPFAILGEWLNPDNQDDETVSWVEHSVGDYRRARTLLNQPAAVAALELAEGARG